MTSAKLTASLALSLCLLPRIASAETEFAQPPNSPLVSEQSNWEWREAERRIEPTSTVRVSVGPGLRVSSAEPQGGLFVALDVGARAAGVRGSASWLRAGSDQGVSQYAAELWIDFGAGRALRPIIGAGAGVARLASRDADGAASTATIGVGVLRGSLDYVLPIAGADARVGIDAIGSVPATAGGGTSAARPWLLAVARVGVGF